MVIIYEIFFLSFYMDYFPNGIVLNGKLNLVINLEILNNNNNNKNTAN